MSRLLVGALATGALVATGLPWLAAAPANHGAVVATEGGLVRGVTADGVRTFQGIPFAAPLVGQLRWMAPRAGVAVARRA